MWRTTIKQGDGKPLGFVDPVASLFGGASDNHVEHAPMEITDAAKAKYAIAPASLQRIPKSRPFSEVRRIRGVDNQDGAGFQQANRNSFPVVALLEAIRNARPQNTVDPALENGGRLAPPIRVDDDDAVSRLQVTAMSLDLGWQSGGLRDFLLGEQWLKTFDIQIVEYHAVTLGLKLLADSLCQAVVETARIRMSQDDQNVHSWPAYGMKAEEAEQ